MRRIPKLIHSGSALQTSRCPNGSATRLMCRTCQHRSTPYSAALSTSATQNRPDFLERTRRRMWGTDQPPGPDDPYSGGPWRKSDESSLNNRMRSLAENEDVGKQEAIVSEQHILREARELYQQSVDEAADHRDYVPANTWDGLEMVGGEKDWNSGATFQGFRPSRILESPEEITMAIYRATVEVFLAASAGESLIDLAEPQPGALVTVSKDVRVRVENGDVKLEFPGEDIIQNLVSSIRNQPESIGPVMTDDVVMQNYTRESLQEDLRTLGREWLHVPLSNMAIKFAIVRRIIQLTGIHIPDHVISEVRSMALLVSKLVASAKPRRLADELSNGALQSLTNIRLMQRRETPIDREKQAGRWKLIEESLVRSDLPVVGRW